MQRLPLLYLYEIGLLSVIWSAFFIAPIILHIGMDELSFFFLITLPLLLAWILLTIWSVMLGVRLRKHQRHDLGALFMLIPMGIALALPYVEDNVKFRVMRPLYDAEVSQLPKNGERFKEWSWGGFLFASDGVVYDETDQIGLPAGQQSSRWIARMRNTDLICGDVIIAAGARRLEGHYYLANFGC